MARRVIERLEGDLASFLDPPSLVVAAALRRIRTKGRNQVRLAGYVTQSLEVRERGRLGFYDTRTTNK